MREVVGQFPDDHAHTDSYGVVVCCGRRAGMKLLLVEDEADTAYLFGALLARGGHEVTIASDAREALERASAEHPEVVLSDIGLPGMSGIELAAALRAVPQLREVILIALSGFDRDEDRARSLEAGFDEYLVKPVNAMAIERCIQEVHARKRQR